MNTKRINIRPATEKKVKQIAVCFDKSLLKPKEKESKILTFLNDLKVNLVSYRSRSGGDLAVRKRRKNDKEINESSF